MTDPAARAHDRGEGDEPTLVRVPVWVDYHQVYLLEEGSGLPPAPDDAGATSAGIVRVQPGSALLSTGLHTGPVGFTVEVADHDPGAHLDAYEDVVEISYESPTGVVWLEEWGGEGRHTLPPLPAGPGWYRLRYHARNMDEARQADTADEPIDEYLLQIWPGPDEEPAVLKLSSATARSVVDRSDRA